MLGSASGGHLSRQKSNLLKHVTFLLEERIDPPSRLSTKAGIADLTSKATALPTATIKWFEPSKRCGD
jgi:hypothetical protein